MSKFAFKRLNEVVLFLVFITGLISTFYFKQLIRDGAQWAFRLFNFKSWVLDDPFIRYSSTLIQTPAVILTKLGARPGLVNWLYSFSYFIYPFIALVILRFYLQKKNKGEFLLPLYISFFLTIIPAWAFANSISSEAIVIFWFLYAYIIAEKAPKFLTLMGVGILLLLSYESGAIFYGLAVWLLWREKKLTFRNFFLFVFLTVIQAFNLLFRVMPERGHRYFETSISNSLTTPFWIMILFLLVATFLLLLNNKKLRWGVLIIGSMLCAWTLYKIMLWGPGKLWLTSYDNRVWSIPVSFLILWFMYEALKIKKSDSRPYYEILTFLCLIPGLYHEIKLGIDSFNMMKRVSAVVEKSRGCIVLSLEEQKALKGDSYLPVWDFPFFSIVIQKDKKISTILINDYESDKPKVFCALTPDGKRIEYSEKFNIQRIVIDQNYDFSEVLKRD